MAVEEMKVHPAPPILRIPSTSERVASTRVWVSTSLRAWLQGRAKMGSPTRLTTASAPSTGATGSLACHPRTSTAEGKCCTEGWRTRAMTRSPLASKASTRWRPTMPVAPAIATVRDPLALGLVVIISSFLANIAPAGAGDIGKEAGRAKSWGGPTEVGAPANRIDFATGEARTPRNERPRTGFWAQDLALTTRALYVSCGLQ